MAQPYVGEIRMFGGNFAPAGWMFCNGQLLSIADNDTLFQLIGTTYGGDGQSTFALPQLQSRVPIHQGSGPGLSTYQLAESGGTESVTITTQTMPTHRHVPMASNAGSSETPTSNYWANSILGKPYGPPPTTVTMNAQTIGAIGGSQPHDNMIPYLCVNYIISLFGIFPSPN